MVVLAPGCRCTCINCSALLVDKSHPQFARALKIRNGKKRLAAIMDLCKSRKVCCGSGAASSSSAAGGAAGGAGTGEVDADGNPLPAAGGKPGGLPVGLGGCGAAQPSYRKLGGLKIQVEYSRDAAEANNQADTKDILTPEKAYRVLRGISDEDVRILGLDPMHVSGGHGAAS